MEESARDCIKRQHAAKLFESFEGGNEEQDGEGGDVGFGAGMREKKLILSGNK